jgi:hypothetical protein
MYLPLTVGFTMMVILLLMTIKIVPEYQRIVILLLSSFGSAKSSPGQRGRAWS